MFVGEAPGAEEDRQGLPFVGRAGQLLNELLEEIGLSREDVFIANVLKSPAARATATRSRPRSHACEPYLFEQVRLIEPRVVCTLGNFATKLLTGSPTGITKVRGTPQVHELGGRTVFLLPLFHPAAALRTPAVKETLRGDFATIPALLEQAAAGARCRARRRSPRPTDRGRPTRRRPADQLGFFGWRRRDGGRRDRSQRRRDRSARRPPRRATARRATWSSSPASSEPGRRP